MPIDTAAVPIACGPDGAGAGTVDVTDWCSPGSLRALCGAVANHRGPRGAGLDRPGRRLGSRFGDAGRRALVAELPDGDRDTRQLPPAVLAVAGRALRTAVDADSPGEIAFARVLSRSGRWIVLHGASLVSDGRRRVAVIVEPAHPARIAPLLMAVDSRPPL